MTGGKFRILQEEHGALAMRPTRLLFRTRLDVHTINVSFVAFTKVNASECPLLKNLRRI